MIKLFNGKLFSTFMPLAWKEYESNNQPLTIVDKQDWVGIGLKLGGKHIKDISTISLK